MKIIKIFLPTIILICACSPNSINPSEISGSRLKELEIENKALKSEIKSYEKDWAVIRGFIWKDELPGFWEIGYGPPFLEWRPVLVKTIQTSEKTAILIEKEINNHYPKSEAPGIKFEKIQDNIAYIRILDGEFFTQRMGSTGAEIYAAMITFSFTSLENVSYVYLLGFEEGSHAAPGIKSRFDFLQLFGLIREKKRFNTE